MSKHCRAARSSAVFARSLVASCRVSARRHATSTAGHCHRQPLPPPPIAVGDPATKPIARSPAGTGACIHHHDTVRRSEGWGRGEAVEEEVGVERRPAGK
jgi:hypothetical protein